MKYFILPLALIALGIATVEPWPIPIPVGEPIYAVPSAHAVRNYWIGVYAERFDADPGWLKAISLAENTRGLPRAWSHSRCCVGPMQVNVAVWFGRFHDECDGSDLYDPRINICYGVLIWLEHLHECAEVVECTLRSYVGQSWNIAEGNRYVREVYTNWLEVS